MLAQPSVLTLSREAVRIALYHNLQSGGAKRTMLETVRRLAQRHHVDLFSPNRADNDFGNVGSYVNATQLFPFDRVPEFGSPFGRLNGGVRLVNLRRIERLTRQVAAVIDKGGYDIVLAHPCVITQAPGILRHLRTPSVYYCHEPIRGLYEPVIVRPYARGRAERSVVNRIDPLPRIYSREVGRIDAANVRAATLVMTNSQFTRRSVRRIYSVEAKVNYPAVDSTAFKPGTDRREMMLLSVGALQPAKGFDFVIDSLGTLPSVGRPPLRIISNFEVPGERAYLRERARNSGVRVQFNVAVSNTELVTAYQCATLCVYAPVREPLGLAALESQACETPVVGVTEGGVPETIVDGETGVLTAREPERFGDAIGCMLEDSARRKVYGRAGRAWVGDRWNWERSTAELELALNDASGAHT